LLAGGEDVAQARSVIFALVSLQTLALAFPLRRARTAFWQDGFFTNRFLNGSFILGLALTALAFSPLLAPIFAFRPLQTIEYVLIAAVILLEFFFVEVYKWAMKYGASYRHYSRV
jgi:magnesium-transporting ATPase (P-type)